MKFIRSLPLIWARTRWPFSSSIANIVFGNGSMTVPSTSIASFFATRLPIHERVPTRAGPTHERGGYQLAPSASNAIASSSYRREDLGPIARYGDRVLEMRRERAVDGDDGPAVGLDLDLVRAEREHRLDGQADPRRGLDPAAAAPEVRDVRRLVHLGPDPVADEVLDDAVAVGLGGILDRRRDVADPVARHGRAYTGHHREPGRLDELRDLWRRRTDDERPCRIRMPALVDRADVDRHDLALANGPVARDPVDHLVVDADAQRGRIRVRPVAVLPATEVALERRCHAVGLDVALAKPVELTRRDPRPQLGFDEREHLGNDAAGRPHAFDLGLRLPGDHQPATEPSPTWTGCGSAARTSRLTRSIDCRPSTVFRIPRRW